jgi:hypothetical protein
MDKLVNILESAVHSEASSRRVGVGSIACQKDAVLGHPLGELSLQLPSPHVEYFQSFCDFGKMLLRYCGLDELLGSIDL